MQRSFFLWPHKISLHFALLVVFGLLAIAGVIRVQYWLADPNVFFLADEDQHSKWIRSDNRFVIGARDAETTTNIFRLNFNLSKPVSSANLRVTSFRFCKVWIDADRITSPPLFSSLDDNQLWKIPNEIQIPNTLGAGAHQLIVLVVNRGSYPCLLVSSPDLPIDTDLKWEYLKSKGDWQPVALASEYPVPDFIAEYPQATASLRKLGLWLALLFTISVAWMAKGEQNSQPQEPESKYSSILSPAGVRWGLMAALLVLGINNAWRLPVDLGYDAKSHLEYIRFIVRNGRLPLATDGWQHFQSPLFYLAATPWFMFVSSLFAPETCVKLLRILPILCGIWQVDILYRIARIVFDKKRDLQVVTMVVGGLMPMNIYMSQFVSNEPLVACFTSLIILQCVRLLMELTCNVGTQYVGIHFYLTLGCYWGFALLTKVTPILLTPLLLGVVCYHSWKNSISIRICVERISAAVGVGFLICGWYYLRNWIYLGRPFIGGWDASRGIDWWQDPGYRTWNLFTSFGTALEQPVYSGVQSFWDALYSTMWTDGFVSGYVCRAKDSPWNTDWQAVGAWLAIVPIASMLGSVYVFWNQDMRKVRGCILFAWIAIGIYFFAILDLYVQVPIYSACKASYMLGLLPCFSLLAAAGISPLLRHRLLRAAIIAALNCWAIASFVTYFSVLVP